MKKREAEWYIENKLKPPKAFFEWCYSHISNYKWSNKKETIVASDRKDCHLIEKRLAKNSNLSFFGGNYFFAIVLVTKKRIEIQSYEFSQRIEQGKEFIEVNLSNFEYFSNGQHLKISENYFSGYNFWLTPNVFCGGPYQRTRFYNNNWKDEVRNVSELRYLEMKHVEYYLLENIYKYRNEAEFLQKINAKQLAEEILYPTYNYSSGRERKSIDMRVVTKKWLKKNKNFFRNTNYCFNEFELQRRIKERNGKLVPGIEEYLDYRDIKFIPKGIGMIRFQNWIIKNKVDFYYYRDYLNMLEELAINPSGDENLIIPKDLKVAHDNCVDLINQLKAEKKMKENEKHQKAYEKQLKKRKKLEKEVDGYLFKVPDELNDLIIEGKKLHHCVGGSSYVERHRKGSTTIIFVRDPNNEKEPFYTLEYSGTSIVQIRGKRNKEAPQEIKEAADHWLKIISGKKVA